MANKMTVGLALACAGLAASFGYAWHALGQEREHSAQETAARERAEGRIRDLEQRLGRSSGEFARQPSSAGFGSRAAQASTDGHSGVATLTDALKDRRIGSDDHPAVFRGGPEEFNRRRDEMIEALGLTPRQADALDQIMRARADKMRQLLTQNNGSFDPKAMNQMRFDTDQELQQALGDKYSDYQNYVADMQAEARVEQLGRRLQNSGQAGLTTSQQQQVLDVMTQERAQEPMPTSTQYPDAQQLADARSAWQTDYEKRVSSQLSSVLNSEQMTVYSTTPVRRGPGFAGGFTPGQGPRTTTPTTPGTTTTATTPRRQ
jgi:hypothetical protein